MPGQPSTTGPTRHFGWPMRLFLGVMVFWMAFRSLVGLVNTDKWASELNIEESPTVGLPAPTGPDAPPDEERAERLMAAFDSAWDFFRPWPGPASRAKIHSASDSGRFMIVWLSTRLGFLEHLAGTNQGWDMFCPDVSTQRTLTRARLIYADGSERIVRGPGDPQSLTHFGQRFNYLDLRLAQAAGKGYSRSCLGYCNLLRHRHPRNAAGSPLARIRLYQATIVFPPPGVSATEHMREQEEKTVDGGPGCSGDFYEYVVEQGEGRSLP